MRLTTITNWAYGATVVLTIASATTMLLASRAYEQERAAVQERFELDAAGSRLTDEILLASDHARQFLNNGDPTYRVLYLRDLAAIRSIETRIARLRDMGATSEEVSSVREAVNWAETLRDEQAAALEAHRNGNEALARTLMFGAEYERDLDRARLLIERFEDRVDRRTEATVAAAAKVSRLWKQVSEAVLAMTAVLFLGVLSLVFKRRVLRPVLRLSDVISRLAAQDFAAEPPSFDQVDEIGDMAQAVRIFRENGIERQRLEQEREADMAMRDLLARMTQRMQGCDNVSDLAEVVRRFVPEIAPGLPGRLYLLDSKRNSVVEACHWLAPTEGSGFSPLSCWALRRGLPHRSGGANIDVPCEHIDRREASVATLCLPLTAQRETLGMLFLESTSSVDQPEGSQDLYLRMLAENIGLALANLKLRDALRELAMTDPLTGLANRRSMELALQARLAAAAETGQPISCLMIDVDHFKKFNDEFGHDAGDAILREVGAALRSSIRDSSNFDFRCGGEEFMILLPGVAADAAKARAEHIRDSIEALAIAFEGQELPPVTASIGVATAPDQCGGGRLANAADAALLRAKALGRNRVEVAENKEKRCAA